MANRWLIWLAVVIGVVWGGGKAYNWFSASYEEGVASTRVGGLFSNLHADGDHSLAVAMWLTGNQKTGSRDLEQGLYNAEYARMSSWLAAGGVRVPISRYELVKSVLLREDASRGPSTRPPVIGKVVVVTCQVDGRTVFLRVVHDKQLEWTTSPDE